MRDLGSDRLCGARLWLVVATVAGLPACGSSSDGRAASGSGSARGVASTAQVAALLDEATAKAAATWPGAVLSGVRVGPEADESARAGDRVRVANVYTVRASFEFASDPSDPTARSGAIVCAPTCRVHRAKVKREAPPPPPCGFDAALAAARQAGLTAERPQVGYGIWAADFKTGQTWSGWIFRADDAAPVIEVGAGCQVVR